ncbi:MAG: short chain dehydrogenase [Bacteroidota bacterium]
MKILIIGGSGTIGQKVFTELDKKHEVLIAGRNSGDFRVDLTKEDSTNQLFEKTGELDACICTAGDAAWGDLQELKEEDFYVGIQSKMMGQINLVRIGQHHLNNYGSFTLTTGILSEDPVKGSIVPATVNNAIHGFVLGASRELKKGMRINAVSAGLVEDSVEHYSEYFPGHIPVTMDRVAAAYQKSVEGNMTGEIIRVY